MSRLSDKTCFDLSCLPDLPQLDMHVDAAEFHWLAERERFVTLLSRRHWPAAVGDSRLEDIEAELVETLAREIHKCYHIHRVADGAAQGSPEPFDGLKKDMKISNRDAAADIPTKLRAFVMQWLHLTPEWFDHEPNPGNGWVRLIEDDEDRGYILS